LRANERSAYVEAIAHLTQGLAVLTTLPETPERLQRELDLQVALGSALYVTKGNAAPGHAAQPGGTDAGSGGAAPL
ncbi:MAG: hypothetical protein O7G88_22870, partial [bacterium]|nr:hypothetical protein [bacterium]